MKMETWETGWEVGFPASNADELLLALVVRDLVHGASFDVEAVEDGSELALDFVAGDELQDVTYQLLLSAEIAGTDNRELVQAFTETHLGFFIIENPKSFLWIDFDDDAAEGVGADIDGGQTWR
jgi:hypothetical protein